ncbi:gamma-glutamylcyclotransferase family protein [Rhodopirellula sallentina]|uniref:AIG2 family protein n=1 Tax=Rhodopirellula sallentina SM41 TaxID=1263870 RepID=M5TXQ2_9BACT|nr:gamma-glutamylcyclotransferase family protein [Rhodopirellula sallentina]EMI53794.1 AIG2 family protein [Rhodopirellula sallentina SM41]
MNVKPSETFDHFAYGSNMSTSRLRKRCASAVAVGRGFVVGRRLCFHKIGKDGTAKADAFWTGDQRDVLHGVIFRCHVRDRAKLDRCESIGIGYDAAPVEVITTDAGVTHPMFLYEALPSMIGDSLLPAPWYVAHVLQGAEEHALPTAYQTALKQMIEEARTKPNLR